jgi:hypothetical protein
MHSAVWCRRIHLSESFSFFFKEFDHSLDNTLTWHSWPVVLRTLLHPFEARQLPWYSVMNVDPAAWYLQQALLCFLFYHYFSLFFFILQKTAVYCLAFSAFAEFQRCLIRMNRSIRRTTFERLLVYYSSAFSMNRELHPIPAVFGWNRSRDALFDLHGPVSSRTCFYSVRKLTVTMQSLTLVAFEPNFRRWRDQSSFFVCSTMHLGHASGFYGCRMNCQRRYFPGIHIPHPCTPSIIQRRIPGNIITPKVITADNARWFIGNRCFNNGFVLRPVGSISPVSSFNWNGGLLPSSDVVFFTPFVAISTFKNHDSHLIRARSSHLSFCV